MIHELHFVLGKSLYFELVRISKIYKKSISKTMVLIFDSLDLFLEKNELLARQKKSRYAKVSETKEPRYNVHCYISENQYDKLKFAHSYLNLYSVAQVVRKMIEYFVKANLKYGFEKLNDKLCALKNIWEKMKKNYVNEKRVFVRHFSYKSTGFLIKYTPYFSPVSITLIELKN